MKAKVYSVTTLHAAAEPFEAELPFQIAIVEMEGGARKTVRIEGPRVEIGDEVEENCTWRLRSAGPPKPEAQSSPAPDGFAKLQEALAQYRYPVKLRDFSERDQYPGWFETDTGDGSRGPTMAFEERFRQLACDHIEVWYEVVFWKFYSQQGLASSRTRKQIQRMRNASPRQLWESCLSFVNDQSREAFTSFRHGLGLRNPVMAVPATFASFAEPERFPMVDTRIANWVIQNPRALQRLNPGGPAVVPPKFPGNVLKMDDFDFYQSWTAWCRDTSTRLSEVTGMPWRARDVEMAVWTTTRGARSK